MVIRVIQNKAENHFGEVKDLLANSNKALIASPFISLTVIDKMKNWLTFGFQELTLITTLKEKDPDQLRKVPVLMELFRLKKTRGFHLTVKIDNKLHGKVYIGKRVQIIQVQLLHLRTLLKMALKTTMNGAFM